MEPPYVAIQVGLLELLDATSPILPVRCPNRGNHEDHAKPFRNRCSPRALAGEVQLSFARYPLVPIG